MTSPTERSNHQILFHDSSDAVDVPNSRVSFPVDSIVMFTVFVGDKYSHTDYYPTADIFRIRRTPTEAI